MSAPERIRAHWVGMDGSVNELLRYDCFKITKARVGTRGRVYRVVVLDFRYPAGERQVWWAPTEGWTKLNRQAAREWIADQHERGHA